MRDTFTAADWFEITGRGWAASIIGIEGFNPRGLTGQQVETHMIPDPSGHPFALLVGDPVSR